MYILSRATPVISSKEAQEKRDIFEELAQILTESGLEEDYTTRFADKKNKHIERKLLNLSKKRKYFMSKMRNMMPGLIKFAAPCAEIPSSTCSKALIAKSTLT